MRLLGFDLAQAFRNPTTTLRLRSAQEKLCLRYAQHNLSKPPVLVLNLAPPLQTEHHSCIGFPRLSQSERQSWQALQARELVQHNPYRRSPLVAPAKEAQHQQVNPHTHERSQDFASLMRAGDKDPRLGLLPSPLGCQPSLATRGRQEPKHCSRPFQYRQDASTLRSSGLSDNRLELCPGNPLIYLRVSPPDPVVHLPWPSSFLQQVREYFPSGLYKEWIWVPGLIGKQRLRDSLSFALVAQLRRWRPVRHPSIERVENQVATLGLQELGQILERWVVYDGPLTAPGNLPEQLPDQTRLP